MIEIDQHEVKAQEMALRNRVEITRQLTWHYEESIFILLLHVNQYVVNATGGLNGYLELQSTAFARASYLLIAKHS